MSPQRCRNTPKSMESAKAGPASDMGYIVLSTLSVRSETLPLVDREREQVSCNDILSAARAPVWNGVATWAADGAEVCRKYWSSLWLQYVEVEAVAEQTSWVVYVCGGSAHVLWPTEGKVSSPRLVLSDRPGAVARLLEVGLAACRSPRCLGRHSWCAAFGDSGSSGWTALSEHASVGCAKA